MRSQVEIISTICHFYTCIVWNNDNKTVLFSINVCKKQYLYEEEWFNLNILVKLKELSDQILYSTCLTRQTKLTQWKEVSVRPQQRRVRCSSKYVLSIHIEDNLDYEMILLISSYNHLLQNFYFLGESKLLKSPQWWRISHIVEMYIDIKSLLHLYNNMIHANYYISLFLILYKYLII